MVYLQRRGFQIITMTSSTPASITKEDMAVTIMDIKDMEGLIIKDVENVEEESIAAVAEESITEVAMVERAMLKRVNMPMTAITRMMMAVVVLVGIMDPKVTTRTITTEMWHTGWMTTTQMDIMVTVTVTMVRKEKHCQKKSRLTITWNI